jgi:hypothetical protein
MKRRMDQDITTGLRVREAITWRTKQQGRVSEALNKPDLVSLLVFDESDQGLTDSDFEPHQVQQLAKQATGLFQYYRLSNARDTLALAGDSSQQVSGREEWDTLDAAGVNCSSGASPRDHNVPHVFALAVECAEQAGDRLIPPITGRTIRVWHRTYTSNIDATDEDAFGAFNPDDRGHTQRNWILIEKDLKATFTLWMKNNLKTLSMASATKYVNEVLLKDESPELLARYGFDVTRL